MIGRKSNALPLVFKILPLCAIVVQVFIVVQLYLCSQHHGTVQSRSSENDMRKPLVVFGILTTENNTALRDAQRNTWISTALNADIPFRLTYKFLLDEPSPKTIAENKMHNDIVYLNVTHHGYAKRFGQKIYIWLKYIVENYSDALLGARMDDDVFLCVPQLFERLNLIKSKTLYYGWAHAPGNEIAGRRRIDEMFLVLGKYMMERISGRQLCVSKTQCNEKEQLVNSDWGTGSVATWLSMYDDVDTHFDNDRIIHFGRYKFQEFAPYVRENFCENYFIYHKSTPEIMHKLHVFNKGATVDKGCIDAPIDLDKAMGTPMEDTSLSVTSSGSYFSGEVIREFLLKPVHKQPVHKHHPRQDSMKHCSHWAVVTTILTPTLAVRLISRAPSWCLVVVADLNTPDMKAYMDDVDNVNVKLLTIAEQNILYPKLSKSIPPNNYGRKNIGYIYAMHHGAKAIWDFDDANIGMIDIKDLESSREFVTLCEGFYSNITNPYPYFGIANNLAWPRGIPLQYIKEGSKVPKLCKRSRDVKLGVVQSLANLEPDVDAIYRLTQDIPFFNFTATKETHSPLVLPKHVYAPFNAQATLWLPPAFKYMALPVSVNGRVCDIWRAYVAQHFMHRDGSHVAFTAPYVTQIRNQHEHIRDFNAELDLYRKSKQLVDFLSSKQTRQIRSLVDMYRQLFRRGYIENGDMKFIIAWVQNFENF